MHSAWLARAGVDEFLAFSKTSVFIFILIDVFSFLFSSFFFKWGDYSDLYSKKKKYFILIFKKGNIQNFVRILGMSGKLFSLLCPRSMENCHIPTTM